jgi:putative peptide zinc metalloprotease protein
VTETIERPSTPDERPVLAPGVELIGEYEDSGYKDPPLIARRPDGQVVQLSRLLYLVAARADGQRPYEQIAKEVTQEFGRGLEADDARYLVDEKLRPLGIIKPADGSAAPEIQTANPFLALKFRTGIVPDRLVRGVTTVFRPLFWPPVLLATLAAFGALDYWLFFVHGVGRGLHEVLYNPALFLFLFGMLIAATAFHEFGHATACRYGGAEPGKLGVGLYLVWPAFYTDVTDSYRLSRRGRLRTDLGGVYFNAVFILFEAALYKITGFEAFLIAILIQHFEMFQQFLPFLRLDGYYMVSDLVGVPDLFARMGAILRSMLPGHHDDPRVTDLKPKVRVVVTLWVLIVIPVLAFNLGLIVMNAPRIYGTAWDSLGKQIHGLSRAWGHAHYVQSVASGFQIFAMVIPLAGIVYMVIRLSRAAVKKAWSSSDGRPALRAMYALVGVALIAFIAFIWWPNGDYRPIRSNERWTFQTGVAAFHHVASGDPGLVPADPKAKTDPLGAKPVDPAATSAPTTTTTNDGTVNNPFATPSSTFAATPAPTVAPTFAPTATPVATTAVTAAPTP